MLRLCYPINFIPHCHHLQINVLLLVRRQNIRLLSFVLFLPLLLNFLVHEDFVEEVFPLLFLCAHYQL